VLSGAVTALCTYSDKVEGGKLKRKYTYTHEHASFPCIKQYAVKTRREIKGRPRTLPFSELIAVSRRGRFTPQVRRRRCPLNIRLSDPSAVLDTLERR